MALAGHGGIRLRRACVRACAWRRRDADPTRVRRPTGHSAVPARSTWPWIGAKLKRIEGQASKQASSAISGFPVPECLSVRRDFVLFCAGLGQAGQGQWRPISWFQQTTCGMRPVELCLAIGDSQLPLGVGIAAFKAHCSLRIHIDLVWVCGRCSAKMPHTCSSGRRRGVRTQRCHGVVRPGMELEFLSCARHPGRGEGADRGRTRPPPCLTNDPVLTLFIPISPISQFLTPHHQEILTALTGQLADADWALSGGEVWVGAAMLQRARSVKDGLLRRPSQRPPELYFASSILLTSSQRPADITLIWGAAKSCEKSTHCATARRAGVSRDH